jgi:signal transduction histidine kinase
VRRRLIVTVAASVSMVLLAMLVPLAVLLQDYALEDRLSRAALEVQSTETVVSGGDQGDVAVYIATINEDNPETQTTVLYPGDSPDIGPSPGEDERVVQARRTGVARVDDTDDGGAEILVPVSLGPSTGTPGQTPVILVEVAEPGLGSGIYRAWLVLVALGLLLMVGALWLADRLGRTFVQPIQAMASFARRLGDVRRPEPVAIEGPEEIQQLGQAMNRLVDRVELLLDRERENVSDLSHRLRTPVTALQLRIESLPPSADRDRLMADLADLRSMIDQIVREARRSEREGLVPQADGAEVLSRRALFWEPLAEEQGRPFSLEVRVTGAAMVRAGEDDLTALLDVLLDNAFTHTPDAVAVRVRLDPRPGGGLVLVVEDDGPGFGTGVVARGVSAAGSTGLGLSIAARTARESGGRLHVERSLSGGARVVVELGPPG